MDSDQVEKIVLARLVDQDTETLLMIAEDIGLDVTETHKENKNNCLLKLMVRYLSSSEVESLSDSGLSLFLAINTMLDEIEVKPKVSGMLSSTRLRTTATEGR